MTHPLEQFHFCPRCGSMLFVYHDAKAKRCRQCGFVYYHNMSAAVAAIITAPNGDWIVGTRACEPARGMLDLPGGFVDIGETAEAALLREIKEETGITVRQEQTEYLFSLPNTYEYSNFIVDTLDLFYRVRLDAQPILHPNDDVAALQWLPTDQIDATRFGLHSISKAIEMLKNQR